MTRWAGALLLAVAPVAQAQQARTAEVAPLADNSFLVEEAYNQEPGVVQHIAFFHLRRRSTNWALGVTQEWPAWSDRHQLSYTIPLLSRGAGTAFGDIAVHYRYQALAGDIALAPRVSLLLPTGSDGAETTVGGTGVQVALPASFRLSPRFTAHFNGGAGVIPEAGSPATGTGRLLNGFVGGSLIAFVRPRLNVLVEFLAVGESWDASGWEGGTLGVLGVRWGHDLPGGVQLVPGVGWAVGGGIERSASGPLAYLSLEHRFR
jgi:hypothetical protein